MKTRFQVPWANGRYGFLSLWDVKTYLASRFVDISADLIKIDDASQLTAADWPTAKTRIIEALENILKHCKFMAMTHTRPHLARCLSHAKVCQPGEDWTERLSELESRFNDETALISLFFMRTEKRRFFEGHTPFSTGGLVKLNLPSIHHEGIRAGKCFAIGQHTACVFHLIRAMEIAIKLITAGLGLAEPTRDRDRTWGKRLPTIKGKLDANHSAHPHGWPNRQFYEMAHSFFEAARSPLRNRTMHAECEFDEESAADIFNATGALMRHIATKLKE